MSDATRNRKIKHFVSSDIKGDVRAIFIRRKLAENMKSVPQGGIKWRPGGEILWNSRQVGSRNMRVGKRSICGIMAGILFIMDR